jgi:hypothetical protein
VPRPSSIIRYYIILLYHNNIVFSCCIQLYDSSETYTAHARTRVREYANTRTVEKNAVKLSTVFRVHAAVSPSSLSSSFHLRKVVYGDTSVRAVYCSPQNLWPLIRISCARGFDIIYNIIIYR